MYPLYIQTNKLCFIRYLCDRLLVCLCTVVRMNVSFVCLFDLCVCVFDRLFFCIFVCLCVCFFDLCVFVRLNICVCLFPCMFDRMCV